jgi:hypothetical protein
MRMWERSEKGGKEVGDSRVVTARKAASEQNIKYWLREAEALNDVREERRKA